MAFLGDNHVLNDAICICIKNCLWVPKPKYPKNHSFLPKQNKTNSNCFPWKCSDCSNGVLLRTKNRTVIHSTPPSPSHSHFPIPLQSSFRLPTAPVSYSFRLKHLIQLKTKSKLILTKFIGIGFAYVSLQIRWLWTLVYYYLV